MIRIPFTLPDVGLREIRGLVYLDEGFLVLRMQNALLGVLDTEQDTFKIEPRALAEIRIRRGLLRDRLVIAPKRMELLDLVPGEHLSSVELRVWRKYRPELQRLVAACEQLHAAPRADGTTQPIP